MGAEYVESDWVACQPVRDSEYKEAVANATDFSLLLLDPAGRVRSWNAGAEVALGHRPEQVMGLPFIQFYSLEAQAAGEPLRDLATAGRDGRLESEGWRRRANGSLFWAHVVLSAMRTPGGELTGFTYLLRDRSFRHRREESLRLSEMRFRTLVEGVRDYAIFMLDVEGNIASWNAGAEALHGFTPGEIIDTAYSRLVASPESARKLARTELDCANAEGRFQMEGWRSRKDGGRFWANVLITALRDSRGRLVGYSVITRDLTERLKHEAALRVSEERFRILIESVADYAIVTLDDDGLVTSWNNGAERITGYTSAEMTGRHFSRLYVPEDIRANRPWRQLITARERGRLIEESWRMRRDGSQYWANSVLATLPGVDGGPHSFYMVTQDLSQRRYAETLADTTQRMHEFIAMLAHELRNPLAPIRNAVALMQRRGVADPLIESMRQTIERQTQNLARIVDELLDVNRIARGQLVIEKQSVDLRDILARAVETSQPLIDSHGHTLHIDIADRPIECFGDPMRLVQAVVNILNNAAKYTSDGGDIWLSAARVDGRAEIRIRDNGRGIERESIDRVFDLFMQVDPANPSALGGLGVGLALARRVLDLHGGSVRAASDGLGKGTEFTVRLPLSRAPDGAKPQAPSDPEAFIPLRVIIVDDNKEIADSMTTLAQTLGHEVRTAYDGPSGIAVAQEFPPDVVLLDIGMPLMSGYDVARALRNGGQAFTIVAVTGWDHESAHRQAREAGFDFHLVKPVGESALIELLAAIARKRRQA